MSKARRPSAATQSLLAWTFSFLHPHRGRVVLMIVLLLTQIGLGALQPWPLKIVIDYVLDGNPLPEPLRHWTLALVGTRTIAILVLFVVAGAALEIINQFVTAVATQTQVATGQQMVYDLRYRLFAHLESLGLHHHITTNTGDAVYRVDVDAYAIENLAIGGVLPLFTSTVSLLVMFVVLVKLDLTIALLSLTIVPFLFLSLRYYATTLSTQEERVKELESNLIQRLYETFSSIRIVKAFAREPYETARYAKAGDDTMRARIAVTWQQSLFGAVVGTITIAGTALVLVVGGMHVLSGRLMVGSMFVVINYLGAVYGPLSAIAHTTGQLQGAVARRAARPRNARAHAGNDSRARSDDRDQRSRRGPLRKRRIFLSRWRRGAARHQLHGRARTDDRRSRFDRRRQDHAGQPDPAFLRCHRREGARRWRRRPAVRNSIAARTHRHRASGPGVVFGNDCSNTQRNQ